MTNKAKISYMIECQLGIIQGLERSLKVLHEEADNEMKFTQLSTHSPYYEKAISQLLTRRKLAQSKIDLLNNTLLKNKFCYTALTELDKGRNK